MSKLCLIFLMNLFFFCLSQKQPQYVNLRDLNEIANQTILMGFDKYTIGKNNLSFNAYFLFKNWPDNNETMYDTFKENFLIDTNITTIANNTPFKQFFNCSFTDEVDLSEGTEKYGQVTCENKNYTERIPKKIQIFYNPDLFPFNGTITSISPFANASRTNLVDLKNQEIFIGEIDVLENVTLMAHKGSYFKIKTGDKNGIFNFKEDYKNIQLIAFSNGAKKIIKCKGGVGEDKNENEYYYIESDGINPAINGELQYAIVNATMRGDKNNKNNYFMLDFGPNEGNSTLSPETTYYKKSSGGLSTGGIIAVLIPCILVLLGVGALVYLLGMRKPPQPMPQVVNNNTIGVGITSTDNIMNK